MQLAHIALEKLSISPVNMRHGKKDTDISDILPSVRTRGVLVPLLVRPNGSPETFEIVAGRRRFFAANAVAAERGSAAPVPCGILDEGDDADALEASLIENLHRRDPDEMTQYETFSRLIAGGKTPDDIAATFGLTARQVAQRLALGNLLPGIREAYRAESIDATSVQHLTLATKRQQQEWLKLFKSDTDTAPRGHQLKQWLLGGEAIPASLALFPLDGLDAQITADLFGEDSYFRDSEVFWTRQNEAITARRDAYLEAGWGEVVVLDKGAYFHTWEHEKRTKRKGGKVFVAVSQRGEVNFHEGYVTRREAQKLDRAAAKDADGGVTPVAQGEVSSGLQSYIDLHRHLGARAALLDAPKVALRLMVAHAIGGSRLWSVKPEPQRSGRAATDASIAASALQADFAARRREALEALDLPASCGLVAGSAEDTAVLFARLLALPDAAVTRILTTVMADSLEVGTGLVEAVGCHLAADLTKTWQPDDAFFDLVRDREVLNHMVTEVAGKAVATGNLTATGKVKKQIIRDHLAGANGRAKVTGWLPGWFAFPVRSYRKPRAARLATARVWAGIAKLFDG